MHVSAAAGVSAAFVAAGNLSRAHGAAETIVFPSTGAATRSRSFEEGAALRLASANVCG